jgi:AAA15 family ATPase/GTPase
MIESIRIKNFKSFQNEDVSFSNFNAIVGLNAAGKTNLISAILLVREMSRGQSISQVSKKIATLPRELFNRFNTTTEFDIEIILRDSEQEFKFGLGVSLISSNSPIANLAISHERLEKKNKEIYEIIYEREGNKLKDSLGKDIPLNVESSQLALSIYVNPDAKTVKQMFSKIHIPTQEIMNARDVIVGGSSPVLAGLLVRLKKANAEQYSQFQKVVTKLIPDYGSFIDLVFDGGPGVSENSEENKEFMILYSEKSMKGNLSLQSVSTGDIRTLFIIASAFALSNNSTLVIEEIENGIHPKRVADIIYHLDTLSRLKNLQIIFTTHSPSVINSLKPIDVIFVSKDINRGTRLFSFRNQKQLTSIQDILNEGGSLSDYLNSEFG